MLIPTLTPTAPDDPDLLVLDGDRLSREDVVGAATAVAERIAGARVLAVHATPTTDTVLAIVGCLIAGVAVVPVPPDVGAAERAHILTDSGAQAWLGEGPADTPLPSIPVRRHARSWHSHPEPSPDTTALILYTSGTTGPPKGVPITRRAIAAGIDALADAWDWTAEDTLAHGLPLFHVHGLVLGVLGPLRVGGRLVHTASPTPERYAAADATMYFGVPTVWNRIARTAAATERLSRARLLVSGSAPLPAPVFDAIEAQTGHRIVERYGMTETLITVSARADGERTAGCVGLPLRGVQTRLRGEDADADDLPQDGQAVGNLQVRGPMVGSRYLNRPDATAQSWLDDGWFDTGDVAVIDPDGRHRIVGRASTDLIKSGGYRIGAGEIETALLGHPAVVEAAVVGVADDDLGQRIVAYVVGTRVADTELIDHVSAELSRHKRPREIRFVDALPRNAMGKVQKKRLGDDS